MSPANWTVVSTLTGCVFQDEDRLPERGRMNPDRTRARHSRSGRIGPGTDPLSAVPKTRRTQECSVEAPTVSRGDIMMSSGSTSLLRLLFSQA